MCVHDFLWLINHRFVGFVSENEGQTKKEAKQKLKPRKPSRRPSSQSVQPLKLDEPIFIKNRYLEISKHINYKVIGLVLSEI